MAFKEGDLVEVYDGDPDWKRQWEKYARDGKLFGHRFRINDYTTSELNAGREVCESIHQKYGINYSPKVLRVLKEEEEEEYKVGDWIITPTGGLTQIKEAQNIGQRYICGMRRGTFRKARPDEIPIITQPPQAASYSGNDPDLERAERLANALGLEVAPEAAKDRYIAGNDEFAKLEKLMEDFKTRPDCIEVRRPEREDEIAKAERLAESIVTTGVTSIFWKGPRVLLGKDPILPQKTPESELENAERLAEPLGEITAPESWKQPNYDILLPQQKVPVMVYPDCGGETYKPELSAMVVIPVCKPKKTLRALWVEPMQQPQQYNKREVKHSLM